IARARQRGIGRQHLLNTGMIVVVDGGEELLRHMAGSVSAAAEVCAQPSSCATYDSIGAS
ncbi:MAG TPA: hypothetical protein VMT53_21040, partial [Terriglobales bacterium]|nr:hypothetical protein [Terriglobales bacterium]